MNASTPAWSSAKPSVGAMRSWSSKVSWSWWPLAARWSALRTRHRKSSAVSSSATAASPITPSVISSRKLRTLKRTLAIQRAVCRSRRPPWPSFSCGWRRETESRERAWRSAFSASFSLKTGVGEEHAHPAPDRLGVDGHQLEPAHPRLVSRAHLGVYPPEVLAGDAACLRNVLQSLGQRAGAGKRYRGGRPGEHHRGRR